MRLLTSIVNAFRSVHRWLPWPLNDIVVASFMGALVSLLGAALLQAVASVGALTALTPSEIWALNADRWLQGLRWVSLYGAAYGVFFVAWARVAHWLEQRPRTRDVAAAGVGLVVLLGLIFGIAATGRREATRTLGRLTEGDVGETVASQQAALSGLSESARELLSSLRATELEVQASRRELETTLAGLAQHERAAASSVSSLRELHEREELIRIQLGQLQEALGGQQPLTRADLDRSQWNGLMLGTIIGLLTGICSAYAYDVLKGGRWRPRPRPGATSPNNAEPVE